MTAARGKLCFVLHAHIPYVAHSAAGRMEERWFYEALTETYLPLLRLFNTLQEKGSPYLALSVTPTLLAMMENEELQERYVSHLKRQIELAGREKSRVRNDDHLFRLASFYHDLFTMTLEQYINLDCRPALALKILQEKGVIELMASAATHAFLPAVQTTEGIQSQICAGIQTYRQSFGRKPKGFWLPECGYDARVRDVFQAEGIEWIPLDVHAMDTPDEKLRPCLAPLHIGQGITAFIRNQSTSELVWNAQDGYPGDSVYREFYRDIGWDIGWESEEAWNYIRPYLLDNGARIDTGIKYYQVTGKGTEKLLYNPDAAMQRTVVHAHHFLQQCGLEADQAPRSGIDQPVITAMYDAELFGHWWFEGIEWLRQVVLAAEQYGFELASPGYVASSLQHPGPVHELSMSTWGRGGYAEVWVNAKNHWMYRHLHVAERMLQRAISIAAQAPGTGGHLRAAAEALALAQSSDWAFILDHDTVVSYALTRFSSHLADFYDHIEQLSANLSVPSFSATREDVMAFPPGRLVLDHAITLDQKLLNDAVSKPGVFMLTWEYPPNVVGGLGRAVSELAETLAKQGETVHVITIAREREPALELRHGVYVHRATMPFIEPTVSFYDWVVLMNLALVDCALELVRRGCGISLIHGHDWLVSIAAEELAERMEVPLVMTIHATEWGRNQGRLTSELQTRIHDREFAVATAADRIFVCSLAMKSEVCGLFQLPEDKVDVFRNGILSKEHSSVQRRRSTNQVLFLGRLVFEKGVHTLLHAMRQVCAQIPDVQLLIAGTGPLESELRGLADSMFGHVDFLGFVGPSERDQLLAEAALTVIPSYYEPFGLVALEAMQAGCPVVVADSGGLAELVDHMVEGRKAIPGDVNSLATQIVDALRDQAGSLRMAA